MRVAILANRANSFVLPMASGLRRMLGKLGVDSMIFHSGLRMLWATRVDRGAVRALAISTAKKALKDAVLIPYLRQLRTYDLIVVINNLPGAFFRTFRVEAIRRHAPGIPIVNYDLHYLPAQGPLLRQLREGDVRVGIEAGQMGLERYDWYLVATTASRYPLPRGSHPYSEIGLDLDDGTLYPEDKTEFTALVDFDRPSRGHASERAVQLAALEETRTKYTVLEGRPASSAGRTDYTIHQMRSMYRRCGGLFLASNESFGLPIVEVQACGGYIFSPYSDWPAAHWMKADPFSAGEGDYSPNFIIYRNDKSKLVAAITNIKDSYDPTKVVDTFLKTHPHYFRGDLAELARFLEMVRNGQIHSGRHAEHHISVDT